MAARCRCSSRRSGPPIRHPSPSPDKHAASFEGPAIQSLLHRVIRRGPRETGESNRQRGRIQTIGFPRVRRVGFAAYAANDTKGFGPIETSTGQRWITPSDNELHFISRHLIPPKRLLLGSSARTPRTNGPSAIAQNPLKVNKPPIMGIITAVRMGASLARRDQSAAPGQIKPTPKQRRAML